MRGFTQGVKDAAEIHIEYYDRDRGVSYTQPAKSVRMQATEHGPVKIIISENE